MLIVVVGILSPEDLLKISNSKWEWTSFKDATDVQVERHLQREKNMKSGVYESFNPQWENKEEARGVIESIWNILWNDVFVKDYFEQVKEIEEEVKKYVSINVSDEKFLFDRKRAKLFFITLNAKFASAACSHD